MNRSGQVSGTSDASKTQSGLIGTYTQRHLSLLIGSLGISRDLTNCLIRYFRLAATNFRMMSGLLMLVEFMLRIV
jgi:hypothetical protein